MIKNKHLRNEKGFVLIVSLIMLLVLSLVGIWSLGTSRLELQIAGNLQRYDEAFNIAQGGAYLEATKLGFDQYTVTDFSVKDGGISLVDNLVDVETDANDPATWPTATFPDTNTTYRFRIAYLYLAPPPPGYDVSTIAAYKFRINATPENNKVNIELGGFKIGNYNAGQQL